MRIYQQRPGMRTVYLLAILLAAGSGGVQDAPPEPLAAEAIMASVAANQDRAERLRSEYVYHQRIRIVTRKTNGKLMRDEVADYEVLPTSQGSKKERKSITGRYWHRGQYHEFQGEPVPEADSLDGDLINDFRNDLTDDKSKDGLTRDLFPLTSEEQKKYQFKLLGEETREARKVYHVAFRPKDKSDLAWAGEAIVDAEDFEPVQVFTKLSRRVPFAIRTFLGTDLPGIGFNVQYRRQPDGVWFPASFGTEFRLHAVFFINRTISISLENTDFEHTHVESRIKGVEPE
jgi:hypothetical protein